MLRGRTPEAAIRCGMSKRSPCTDPISQFSGVPVQVLIHAHIALHRHAIKVFSEYWEITRCT
jgi:hypothetical protein